MLGVQFWKQVHELAGTKPSCRIEIVLKLNPWTSRKARLRTNTPTKPPNLNKTVVSQMAGYAVINHDQQNSSMWWMLSLNINILEIPPWHPPLPVGDFFPLSFYYQILVSRNTHKKIAFALLLSACGCWWAGHHFEGRDFSLSRR